MARTRAHSLQQDADGEDLVAQTSRLEVADVAPAKAYESSTDDVVVDGDAQGVPPHSAVVEVEVAAANDQVDVVILEPKAEVRMCLVHLSLELKYCPGGVFASTPQRE